MLDFTPPPDWWVRAILAEPVELTGGEVDELNDFACAFEWLEERSNVD